MSLIYEGRGRESVVGVERLASGWTIRSSKPDGGKTFSFLYTHSYRPWGPSSLLYSGYRDLGVKLLGRGVDHSPPTSTTVQLDLCSPSVPSWYVTGRPLLYLW